MKSRGWFASLMLPLVAVLGLSSVSVAQVSSGGSSVVVEKVESGTPADRAGLQPEDILLSWSRGAQAGNLRSPLELAWVEAEQAPRGPVTLHGLRGTVARTWLPEPDFRGLQTHPKMTEAALETYRQATSLIAEGRPAAAAEALQNLAHSPGKTDAWAAAWLLLRSGDLFLQTKNPAEADRSFRYALLRGQAAGEIASSLVLWQSATLQRSRDDSRGAITRLQKALDACAKAGPESLMAADILREMAEAARAHADFAKAEGYLARAIALQEKLAPASLPLARSYMAAGTADYNRDPGKAAEYFNQAISIQEKLEPESADFADSLNNLGHIALARGQLGEAEQYYRRSLAIYDRLSQSGTAAAWNWYGLGYIEVVRGHQPEGEQYYRKALAVIEAGSPESMDEATVLESLAHLAWKRGDLKSAEQYYHHALEIARKSAPSGYTAATALTGLGSIASWRQDLSLAVRYERQALALYERLEPSGSHVADTLRELGDLARIEGDAVNARTLYLRALRIHEKVAPNSASVVVALTLAGEAALLMKDFSAAEAYLQRAVSLRKTLGPDSPEAAETLHAMGDLARLRGNLPEAEDNYGQALAIRRKVVPGSRSHAESLIALAQIERQRDPVAAARLYEEALLAFENQTSMLGGIERNRSAFRSTLADYYREYLSLLIGQRQTRRAFEILERSRAQTLLEMLVSAGVDVRRGVAPELLARERSLRERFSAATGEKLRRANSGQSTEAADKETRETLAQYEEAQRQIRSASPGYAALMQPGPATADAIQNELDDSDTLLLEYSLGAERSYLFAVTKSDLQVFTLPGRDSIERAARRFYRQISLAASAESSVGAPADDRLAAELSRMVLGPAAGILGDKRLLIVADGGLQFVPFAVLPEPAMPATRPGMGHSPLMVRHEIVSLPSASVLSVLRKEAAGRNPAPRSVAVLADPVFDPRDARVRHRSSGAAPVSPAPTGESRSAEMLMRSASDAGMLRTGRVYLPRLAFSRQEAFAIRKLLPSGDGLMALDFEASRAAAVSGDLSQYRIVHFATHALLDSEHPEFSGLVFSLVGEHGEARNGFLSLQDIYNLNLPAELVVLSACETGLGKAVKAEGLVGLTRGFIYAGASRVLASLWKVDDAATAELMGRFYTAMATQKMPPSAALRQAQISMWKERRWAAPFFWGAFQLQGEYR